jgi:glycosyltransferase involved in cell wall biosynthesis
MTGQPGTGPAARVGIGMPVFNGAGTLARAVRSLQSQTNPNWSLLICDNASTDDTPVISARLCGEDRRIRYMRHAVNVGAPANFATALHGSPGEFFMWAAHDDQWHPEFIQANVSALDQDPGLVASVSRILQSGTGSQSLLEPGTFALDGSPRANRRRFLRRPGMNSRIYALYRRAALAQCVAPDTFWAFDWAIVLRVLACGRFHEVPRPLLIRNVAGESSRWIEALPRYAHSLPSRLVPLAAFTGRVLRIAEVRHDPMLWLLLAWWNSRFVAAILYSFLTRPRWTAQRLLSSLDRT